MDCRFSDSGPLNQVDSKKVKATDQLTLKSGSPTTFWGCAPKAAWQEARMGYSNVYIYTETDREREREEKKKRVYSYISYWWISISLSFGAKTSSTLFKIDPIDLSAFKDLDIKFSEKRLALARPSWLPTQESAHSVCVGWASVGVEEPSASKFSPWQSHQL